MEKRWTVLTADEAKVLSLKEALHINYTICSILVQRGIDNYNAAKNFFRPQLSDLYSPWLMKDMEKAVYRILKAIEQKEKILRNPACAIRKWVYRVASKEAKTLQHWIYS